MLISFTAFLFFIIALIHLYWVLGGQVGLHAAIPKKFRSQLFSAEYKMGFTVSTAMMVLILLMCSWIVFSLNFEVFYIINEAQTLLLIKIFAVVFLIRAIGDFNMFGLFKKASEDIFAIKDSQIYVPLCLTMSFCLCIIAFAN